MSRLWIPLEYLSSEFLIFAPSSAQDEHQCPQNNHYLSEMSRISESIMFFVDIGAVWELREENSGSSMNITRLCGGSPPCSFPCPRSGPFHLPAEGESPPLALLRSFRRPQCRISRVATALLRRAVGRLRCGSPCGTVQARSLVGGLSLVPTGCLSFRV